MPTEQEKRRLKREYLEKTGQVGPVRNAAYYHRIIEKEKAERAEEKRREEAWLKKRQSWSYLILHGAWSVAWGMAYAVGAVILCAALLPLAVLGIFGIWSLLKWSMKCDRF
ncbi:MAG: hypothetical protein ABSA41_20860 [Terriglobia bacterium]